MNVIVNKFEMIILDDRNDTKETHFRIDVDPVIEHSKEPHKIKVGKDGVKLRLYFPGQITDHKILTDKLREMIDMIDEKFGGK